MERKKFLALAIVGVFILTSVGITQAGGWKHGSSGEYMHKSSGHEKPAKQEMEAVYAPEFEEGEYGGVIETGDLPSSGASGRLLETEEVPDWFDEPTTE